MEIKPDKEEQTAKESKSKFDHFQGKLYSMQKWKTGERIVDCSRGPGCLLLLLPLVTLDPITTVDRNRQEQKKIIKEKKYENLRQNAVSEKSKTINCFQNIVINYSNLHPEKLFHWFLLHIKSSEARSIIGNLPTNLLRKHTFHILHRLFKVL